MKVKRSEIREKCTGEFSYSKGRISSDGFKAENSMIYFVSCDTFKHSPKLYSILFMDNGGNVKAAEIFRSYKTLADAKKALRSYL